MTTGIYTIRHDMHSGSLKLFQDGRKGSYTGFEMWVIDILQ